MTLRFVLGGGTLTLFAQNLRWAASVGFTEIQIVVSHSVGEHIIPSPKPIHDAGMTATLNIYNGNWGPGGGAGGAESGFHQAIKQAGWDMIAGEGVDGSVVASVMNNVPYCNYFGADGADGALIDVYAPPWNHPTRGPNGHCDYVRTYYRGITVPTNQSCIDRINQAKGYGSLHYGPLCGMWDTFPQSIGDIEEIIDATGSDTICFLTSYNFDAISRFHDTFAESYFNALKDRYGVS